MEMVNTRYVVQRHPQIVRPIPRRFSPEQNRFIELREIESVSSISQRSEEVSSREFQMEQVPGCFDACYDNCYDQRGRVRHFDSTTGLGQIYLRSTANSFEATRDILFSTSEVIGICTGGAILGFIGMKGDFLMDDRSIPAARWGFSTGTKIISFPLKIISTAVSILVSSTIAGPLTSAFYIPVKMFHSSFSNTSTIEENTPLHLHAN